MLFNESFKVYMINIFRGTSVSYKFGHQAVPQIWSLGGATCNCYKLGHQVARLALVLNLATRWRRLHCNIAGNCPIGIISYY